MTWLGEDEGLPALFLAADSLLSDPAGNRWHYAIKIARSYPTDEYVAYCGDSGLALAAITQATALVQATSVLARSGTPDRPTLDARSGAWATHLDEAVKAFPSAWLPGPTRVLYAGFDPRRRGRPFGVYVLTLAATGVDRQEVPLAAGRVHCFGSGKAAADDRLKPGMGTPDVLGVLRDVIDDPAVRDVGGAPQMVVIRETGSTPVGFVSTAGGKAQATLFGLPIRFKSRMERVQFLDEQFRKVPYPHAGRVRPIRGTP